MAKNVAQVFAANPITVIGNTDVIYVVQTDTTDAAISGANLKAMFILAGSIITPAQGGTGVNNGTSTITIGGNVAFSGAFTFAGTLTANTAVTFPVSGTLATTGQLPTPAALTESNDTNVTMTLGGTPATALLQAVSMTLGWSGQLALTRGGTNASLVASNGGIFYSTASAGAILSGTATANQVLLSGSSTTPAWSTAVYPASTTINQILYSSAANTITGIVAAASSILVTNASSVPAWGTTLPSFTTNTITFSPTTAGLKGTTTNDSTAAGNVGEFISSTVAAGAPLTISNGAVTSLTSISLSAGDWDVNANVYTSGTTITAVACGISVANNTLPATQFIAQIVPGVGSTVGGLAAPFQRVSLASTTTYYIIVFAQGTGTLTAVGGIYARRAR